LIWKRGLHVDRSAVQLFRRTQLFIWYVVHLARCSAVQLFSSSDLINSSAVYIGSSFELFSSAPVRLAHLFSCPAVQNGSCVQLFNCSDRISSSVVHTGSSFKLFSSRQNWFICSAVQLSSCIERLMCSAGKLFNCLTVQIGSAFFSYTIFTLIYLGSLRCWRRLKD
jgi:hypothetical protein